MINLSDIPDMLHHAKALTQNGFISQSKVTELIKQCQFVTEKHIDSKEIVIAVKVSKALKSIKEFSYWLLEHLEEKDEERFEGFDQALRNSYLVNDDSN